MNRLYLLTRTRTRAPAHTVDRPYLLTRTHTHTHATPPTRHAHACLHPPAQADLEAAIALSKVTAMEEAGENSLSARITRTYLLTRPRTLTPTPLTRAYTPTHLL